MSTNQKNNEEEVDLGSLFVIIGKGFSKFFNFIGAIFKGIFDFVISILLFIKQNFIKIGVATVIGFVVGLFLEVKSSEKYGSNLLVKPNFGSVRQLYNNVNYYNELVKQKDTVALKNIFKISMTEASSLKSFEIEPVKVENDIVNSYNDLVISIDTLASKNVEFVEFKESFTNYDYEIHKINVVATKPSVFRPLGDVIINSIVENNYFKRKQKITNQNLIRTDSLYRENLSQIDSLRRVYMTVLVEEAKKQTQGTNIDLGSNKKTTKELELFEKNRSINYDLKIIAEEKADNFEIINIVSNFQPVGYKIKGVTKNYAFLLALLGASLMIVFLLLIKLNTFLNNYKK